MVCLSSLLPTVVIVLLLGVVSVFVVHILAVEIVLLLVLVGLLGLVVLDGELVLLLVLVGTAPPPGPQGGPRTAHLGAPSTPMPARMHRHTWCLTDTTHVQESTLLAVRAPFQLVVVIEADGLALISLVLAYRFFAAPSLRLPLVFTLAFPLACQSVVLAVLGCVTGVSPFTLDTAV